jgi:hypothetical protein
MLRAFKEGGEGMWFLLFLMAGATALVLLGAVALGLLRPAPFWRFVSGGVFFVLGLLIIATGAGFHAIGERKIDRAIENVVVDGSDVAAQIHAEGDRELSWLYFFAPIAALPAFGGAAGCAAYAVWGMRVRPEPR